MGVAKVCRSPTGIEHGNLSVKSFWERHVTAIDACRIARIGDTGPYARMGPLLGPHQTSRRRAFPWNGSMVSSKIIRARSPHANQIQMTNRIPQVGSGFSSILNGVTSRNGKNQPRTVWVHRVSNSPRPHFTYSVLHQNDILNHLNNGKQVTMKPI